MAKSSSTTLLVAAAILTIVGGMIPSPEGRVLIFLIGGLVAIPVLYFGPSTLRRAIALAILIAIVAQAIPAYRQYQTFRAQQRSHVQESKNPGR